MRQTVTRHTSIEQAVQAADPHQALTFLKELSDTELADALSALSAHADTIEPDKAFVLSLISELSNRGASTKSSLKQSIIPMGNTRFRMRVRLLSMVRFVAPAVLVMLVGVVVLLHPFSREQQQVAELKTIGSSEKTFSESSSHIAPYFTEEKALSGVDQSIADIAQLSAPVAQNSFDVTAVDKEAAQAMASADLNILWASDSAIKEIDIALSNF